MLKKYLFMVSIALFVFGCGDSESKVLPGNGEEDTPGSKPEIASISLGTTGTQGIVIRDWKTDYTQEVTVNYKGSKVPESAIGFGIAPWTEAEMEAYNTEKGSNYRLLPADVYQLPTTGSIDRGQTKATVQLTIKAGALKKLVEDGGGTVDYMLPLRLTSETAEVQKLGSEVMYNVILSLIRLNSLVGEQINVFVENEETVVRLDTRLMEGNNFAECVSPFAFAYQVPENAPELVEAFNKTHGTGYALMPGSYYTLGEGRYAAGESATSAPMTIRKNEMGNGVYVLPVRLVTGSDADVLADGTISYVVAGQHSYTNPIIRLSVPDPTAIRAQDGYYYLYGTEDLGWIPVFKSKDMVNWERQPKDCFQTPDSRPNWEGNRSLWAPEIRYINGKYVLYYSWAIWGNHWNSEVGVAVSDNPTGPFTDKGQVIDASEMNVENSIDQFEYDEDGRRYLFWGSFHGIYATELTDDGLSVKRGTDGRPVLREHVAGSAYEGTCIYKRGGYYYLFASIGSCCEGANSTYQTVVGRSESLFGPYVNKAGGRMLDNKHEVIISGAADFVGTGHNSIIQHDDAGQTWIIFHGYVRAEADKGRYVLLNQLMWDENGWPYVVVGTPAVKAFAPIIE